jgi:hypothetical protein
MSLLSRFPTDAALSEEGSKAILRRRAEAERDADLDQVLRALGNEVLQQEIPDRPLRLLRAAAEAARAAKLGVEAETSSGGA